MSKEEKGLMRKMRTPKSKIRNALRKLWLQSRERGFAIKRDRYTCQRCGRKKSVAKGREISVEVHHKDGHISWDELIDVIQNELLCHPDNLETLCRDCHEKEGKNQGVKK